MPDNAERNLLHNETSPYLLQHADNPVNWQPWTAQTLAEATAADKPILLSIGYSACHWCHVMAHESFENAEIAALMNDGFVNIKVDREERPDLDQIYQLAHQVLTQRPGGWPLTMFLTPQAQLPFFGGTYFPDQARHGMPGFADILTRVGEFFRNNRGDIETQGAKIIDLYRQLDPKAPPGVDLVDTPLLAARQALLGEFDGQHGGFGTAPKFPNPGSIERLLRHWHANSQPPSPDLQSLYMATRSLQVMAEGGLYDQLGGGFFRYCVDANWQIPHFEKMLYDNAALLAVYAQAYKATGEQLFWRVANETADWASREMRSPDGAFYATLDADSDNEEGAFYAWNKAEADTVLAGDETLTRYFGFDQPANFEDKWHLTMADPDAFGDDPRDQEKLATARAGLFALREARNRPFTDTKSLTAWNGMMIRAFAIAARHLERDDLTDSACCAVDFVHTKLYFNKRLQAVYKDGQARFNGYLDDYAFMLDGLLELLQTRFRKSDLIFACELADALLNHFMDVHDGGFYFTSHDHETLLHRMKPFGDNATPAGNGIAAKALVRLGHLLGDNRYIDAAENTLKAAFEPINRIPHAHCALLTALEELLSPTQIVVIRAATDELAHWQQTGKTYAPRRMMLAIADDIHDLPAALATRSPRAGGVAYVCSGQHCDAPLDSPEALAIALR